MRDAVCSSSDEGHDALMKLFHTRYSEQIEVADAADVIARWRDCERRAMACKLYWLGKERPRHAWEGYAGA